MPVMSAVAKAEFCREKWYGDLEAQAPQAIKLVGYEAGGVI